jgi:hypothetical protein
VKLARVIDWVCVAFLFLCALVTLTYVASTGYFDPALEWVRERVQ